MGTAGSTRSGLVLVATPASASVIIGPMRVLVTGGAGYIGSHTVRELLARGHHVVIYDLEHVCTGHPLMSKEEWQGIYNDAWNLYYSDEHLETLMKRMVVSGNKPERIWAHALQFAGCIRYEKVHPLQGGYFRRKVMVWKRDAVPARQRPYGPEVWDT